MKYRTALREECEIAELRISFTLKAPFNKGQHVFFNVIDLINIGRLAHS